MRIGSFNVENLFSRPLAFSDDRGDIVEAHAALAKILISASYSPADQVAIIDLLGDLGLARSDEGKYARFRQNRGRLIKRASGNSGPIKEVVAKGRDSWMGSIELERAAPKVVSVRHTAQVIADVDADVLGIVEVENRPVLKAFASAGLVSAGVSYASAMVIDGNDDRGIDVGILTKPGFEIVSIRSHVDDVDAAGQLVFSRDCPEYEIRTPSGQTVVVMVNHFKSKLPPAKRSNEKRRSQADRVKELYQARRAEGFDLVAVVGDLNDTPGSKPLEPLLAQTDLRDVTDSPAFTPDPNGRPGTFGNGTASQKIDYVLLSPALFANVTGGGIFRMGVWGGTNGTLFPHYPTMKSKTDQASDHAAIYADVAI
jgi:endonuclease/exonuclease/phosphatase family metal-dependent hydrolase